jgi:2-polyprenyl-3-methyl-5-hydroxy-6-metoxy-1,4-benzoquinol methylase
MLLNRFERLLLAHPLRDQVQLRLDARRLRRLGGRIDGGRVLELGCGRGAGIEAAFRVFGAASVDAGDIDPRMVALAERRSRRRLRGSELAALRLQVSDAATSGSDYDAVFSYQVLHHVEDWRAALSAAAAALKPGGRLFLAESLSGFLEHPLVRRLMRHPTDRFDAEELHAELRGNGLEVLGEQRLGSAFAWLAARRLG